MSPIAYVALYSLAIVAVSLIGGWVPIYVRLTHRRMQLANSLVAGFMLGVALLILLPHGLMAVSVGVAMGWMILGLLVMFFLERFFCYHHHDVPPGAALQADHHHHVHQVDLHDHAHPHNHGHAHDHTHDHEPHAHPVAHGHSHKLSWTGAATGLVLHSLIDGISLAAAVYAEPLLDHAGSFWPGLAVFLVVALHRPLDSMTLLTLTAGRGWSNTRRHLVNALFALAVPVGSLLFVFGIGSAGVEHSVVAGCALAFAAGVFLCVSLSDLLPELQFHSHDRVPLSAALLLGLGLAVGVQRLESQTHDHSVHDHSAHGHDDAHAHDDAPDTHGHTPAVEPADDHAGHDHAHDDHGHAH